MKRFQPEDMKYLTYVCWPAISPDGTRAACVKYHGEESTGDFPSWIDFVDLTAETPAETKLTEDGHSEKQPVFSADGRALYYLSDRSGAWQIWQRDLTTHETRQLTTLRHGVTRFDLFEPASDISGTKGVRRIAFEATLWPEEIESGSWYREMTAEEQNPWEEELDWRPYVAEDLVYKMDEWYGMRKGEYQHIGYCNEDGSEPHLIDAGCEICYPAWAHDGRQLAFMGYPYSGAKGRQAEVLLWDDHAGKVRQLTHDLGIYADHAPLFTKDDRAVIAAGFPPFEDGSTVMLPYQIDIETGGNHFLLDPDQTEPCCGIHPMQINRSEREDNRYYMTLDAAGAYLVFQSFHNGKGGVYRVRLDDPRQATPALLTDEDILAFVLADNGRVVYTSDTSARPAELFVAGTALLPVQLTRSNDWIRDYTLGKVTEHWTRSRDGEADLQYWIVTPPDFDPEKRYPAVLDAKGGPETCYTEGFWHEFQALAAQDIIVVYGNPRGSTGYSRPFNAGAICWRDGAMEDHLAILDAAISQGSVDPDHLGITGGSYGGYMTMKLLGRTDTFTAAVAQRALADPVTSYGTGDMGFVSSRPLPEDFHMIDELRDRAEGNIISYVDAIKTPLLILHASNDYRCGFEQAEQIFIPMHERNPEIPLRLVRFPGENHALTRTGKLQYQIRHLREMARWFRKYLVDDPWKRIDTGAHYGLAAEGRLTVNGETQSSDAADGSGKNTKEQEAKA